MTTVIRWNPLREMAEMQNSLNRLFDETWRTGWSAQASIFPIDVYETNEAYTVTANLPGVDQDKISITMNQNVLMISAEVPQHTPAEGERVIALERPNGQFSRSITLPRPVHTESIEAVYENGVLTLTLPVAPEAKPRQIQVKTSKLLQSNN
jgi:HSP20 family protein